MQGHINMLNDELQLQSKATAEIEHNYKALDTRIGSLQKENEQLNQNTLSSQNETAELNRKLTETVAREEYDKIISQIKEIKENEASLKKEMKEKTKEYDNLQKNYGGLEKEYNALYENISKTK